MKPAQPIVAKNKPCNWVGFTLIEMMVVLVLVGILGAYAIPKMLNNSAATLDAQAKTFASDLRRAQLLATLRGVSLCVLAGGSSYSIVYQCTQPSNTIIDPVTGQPFVGAFTNGVALTNAPVAPPLEFNNLGQPNHAASYVIAPSNGLTSFHINVAALTGYVSTTAVSP